MRELKHTHYTSFRWEHSWGIGEVRLSLQDSDGQWREPEIGPHVVFVVEGRLAVRDLPEQFQHPLVIRLRVLSVFEEM